MREKDHCWRTAASKAVMRAGRHYAQFTVVSGIYMFFGVTRPGWDCFYCTGNGWCFPGCREWEGM